MRVRRVRGATVETSGRLDDSAGTPTPAPTLGTKGTGRARTARDRLRAHQRAVNRRQRPMTGEGSESAWPCTIAKRATSECSLVRTWGLSSGVIVRPRTASRRLSRPVRRLSDAQTAARRARRAVASFTCSSAVCESRPPGTVTVEPSQPAANRPVAFEHYSPLSGRRIVSLPNDFMRVDTFTPRFLQATTPGPPARDRRAGGYPHPRAHEVAGAGCRGRGATWSRTSPGPFGDVAPLGARTSSGLLSGRGCAHSGRQPPGRGESGQRQ